MLSTGTPLADRTDTKVCRISRGTQSSPSPAFLVIMRNARITLFAVRGVPVLRCSEVNRVLAAWAAADFRLGHGGNVTLRLPVRLASRRTARL